VFASLTSTNPVSAICAFVNGGVCVGCGDAVYLLKIDAGTREVYVAGSVEVGGVVRVLESVDGVVYVSVGDRGLCVLRWERGFEEVWGDREGKLVMCFEKMGRDGVAVGGADGSVRGVVEGKDGGVKEMFSLLLDTTVLSLYTGVRNDVRYDRGIRFAAEDDESMETGGVFKGCTVGGILFSFFDITKRVRVLLTVRCTRTWHHCKI
jgi:hypothetical protein